MHLDGQTSARKSALQASEHLAECVVPGKPSRAEWYNVISRGGKFSRLSRPGVDHAHIGEIRSVDYVAIRRKDHCAIGIGGSERCRRLLLSAKCQDGRHRPLRSERFLSVP